MVRALPIILLVFVVTGTVRAVAEEVVDFNRDVRPILADKCFHCHGPDQANRKGDLRLDNAESAARILNLQQPEKSEFVLRITSDDPETRMPPSESNFTKRLSVDEIATLKSWIRNGAKFAKHWAFEAPRKTDLPMIPPGRAPTGWKNDNQHVIDRFVAHRLANSGLRPNERADKATLIRRVTLDLTGLPPTIDETDAFLVDQNEDAFEKVVDRLLKSPRYGERMALAWMDLARYGDSSVYHADGPRDMWPWRDWVINAFNQNFPFDQFTVEQIAGDLLPNATLSQRVASGFNRNHATTDEGGVIPEEFRVDYVLDRVKTVSNTWLAMSFECGQCHDHKYDPLSQREYYQFYAFFNNTKDGGMQTRNGNSPPLIDVPDPEAELKRSTAQQQRQLAVEKIQQHRSQVAKSKAFKDWFGKSVANPRAESSPNIDSAGREKIAETRAASDGQNSAEKSGDALLGLPATGLSRVFEKLEVVLPFDEDNKRAFVSDLHGFLASDLEGRFNEAKRPNGDGVKLNGNVGAKFPEGFELEWNEPFTFAAWMKVPKNAGGYLLAKMNNAKDYQGFDFGCEGLRPGVHLVHRWPGNALKVYTENEIKPDTWHHVVITSNGTGKAAGIRIYVDGNIQETNVHADSLSASIRNRTPLSLASRSDGPKFKGDVDDIMLWRRELTSDEVKLSASDFIASARSIEAESRTEAVRDTLLSFYLRTVDKQQLNLMKDLAKRTEEIRKAERGVSSVMVMEDLPMNQMRPTFVLMRGQYDQPQKDKQVEPGTPAAFPPMTEDMPRNRLGLAQWLVRKDHPLTARVTVNRIWQLLFGEGLVRSTEDFGLQGEMPSHPELLDWLAVDFVEHGWDVKRLVRQIVLSESYQQSSRFDRRTVNRDPENRLLSRGARFRIPGEVIRDQALFVSGLFVEKIGGPSVRPYQPNGIWEEVALDTNLSKYVQDHGEKLYRRSMYTYWKRSAPHPSLQIFDAPTREKCVGRRPRTNTPLQALVTLNDPQFVEAARGFAQRIIRDGGATVESRIDFAIKAALGRSALDLERSVLRKFLEAQVARFEKDQGKATELLKNGESQRDERIPAAEHAAWTIVASTVMNMDEFVMRN